MVLFVSYPFSLDSPHLIVVFQLKGAMVGAEWFKNVKNEILKKWTHIVMGVMLR